MVELAETVEGRTRLLVPSSSLGGRAPKTFPAFFNPAARVNRDISVAVARCIRPATYADVLGGTGARGVRVANEASRRVRVTVVDFNREALALARRNARRNGLHGRCKTVHSEANQFLYSRFGRDEKFAALDIDPFGSPAPFVQGALAACADRGILSVTATDTAALCGVYPKVSLRRYSAISVRNECMHETAIRILAGFCARSGGVNDIWVEPVAAHSTLHYIRLYMRVGRGATRCEAASKMLGYLSECHSCHRRSVSDAPPATCGSCGGKVKPAGPLWSGPILDEELVGRAASWCALQGWEGSASTLSASLGIDAFPPYGYSLERECSRQRVASVSLTRVLDRLGSAGHKAMVHPFDDLVVKTTAGYEEFSESVRESSAHVPEADKVHL